MMKRLRSWVLWMLAISLLAVWPTATAHATDTTWQDLPDNLFGRMVCFDGGNADVLWATDGNAYRWKTSTQLTNYTMPANRSTSTRWCGNDGWFYSTEMTIVYDATTSSYAYTDFKLLRRSLTHAPVVVANLPNDITAHHTDSSGNTSLVIKNNQQITVWQSTDGVSWRNQSYTFRDNVIAMHIAMHDASQVYVLTMPKTAYRENEALPRNRTVAQLSIWKTSNAGQRWQKQAQISLPKPCTIAVYPHMGNVGNYPDYLLPSTDPQSCASIQLQLSFIDTPTRYTSPAALAFKITYIQNNLLVGKTLFSADSGRTWQDVQHIQGTSTDRYQSFYNDSSYPEAMYRPIPELIYAPSYIFFSAYMTQHLNSTHGGVTDIVDTSINRAPAMETRDNMSWHPLSRSLVAMCQDTNVLDGSKLVTITSMPLVQVCKNAEGIAYFDIGARQWRQISDDNPYARLVAVSDTLPLTIVRQRCTPSPMYGRYPTLDCTNLQYVQVTPANAVTRQVTITTPLGIPYEPATQHTIDPRFLAYWQHNGGLAQFGYPKTEPFYEVDDAGHRLLVQYFERNRFEYHPENYGTPYTVQLGLIGNYFGAKAQQAQPGPFARQNGDTEPGQIYFAETGHTLRNAFKQHWQTTGGLAQYGYPISEEFYEVSPADGQTYVVQYFERARFEWHPEHIGTPYEVLLGLLGNQLLSEKGWE
jgi:hypothetical protein